MVLLQVASFLLSSSWTSVTPVNVLRAPVLCVSIVGVWVQFRLIYFSCWTNFIPRSTLLFSNKQANKHFIMKWRMTALFTLFQAKPESDFSKCMKHIVFSLSLSRRVIVLVENDRGTCNLRLFSLCPSSQRHNNNSRGEQKICLSAVSAHPQSTIYRFFENRTSAANRTI